MWLSISHQKQPVISHRYHVGGHSALELVQGSYFRHVRQTSSRFQTIDLGCLPSRSGLHGKTIMVSAEHHILLGSRIHHCGKLKANWNHPLSPERLVYLEFYFLVSR